MSELKATPGEWISFEYVDAFGEGCVAVTTRERQKRNLISIVEVETEGELMVGLEQEQIANANLICASKSLYQALEAVLEFGTDPNTNRGNWALEKARQALSQARGE